MTIFGVGPIFYLFSSAYFAGAYWLSARWPNISALSFIPGPLRTGLAAALIACGLSFISYAAWTVHRAFRAGKLCTTGAFAVCRNPIYSSWMLFVVPGLALLLNSWPALTTPLFMYCCLRALVRREEAWLEKTFGDEYREYKRRVPAVLPIGWILSRLSKPRA